MYHKSIIEEDDEEMDKVPEKKLWKIVKYCKSKNKQIDGYKLMPGDMIKVGRFRFRVRDI